MSPGRVSPVARPGSLLKVERVPKRKHLALIRLLPCLACGANPAGEAHHVRMGANSGMSTKPDDNRTVPLCFACHERAHRIGEVKFWGALAINPITVASRLFTRAPDLAAMRAVVFAERERRK